MNREPASEVYYVYLACCANGAFYAGCTGNVEQRIAAHNAGRGGRYTRRNRPLSLVAAWPFNSRAEARRAERDLKGLPHERKRALAESAASLEGVCTDG
jgi:putative endonuclease